MTDSATAAAHPTYIKMVSAAIAALKERNGSSRQAVLKYIMDNYKLGSDQKPVNSRLKVALRNGIAKGVLKHVGTSTGANASFKLAEKAAAKPKKVKSPKKKAAKKPAAKEPAAEAEAEEEEEEEESEEEEEKSEEEEGESDVSLAFDVIYI